MKQHSILKPKNRMKPVPLTLQKVQQLKMLCYNYGTEAAVQKNILLTEFSNCVLRTPTVIKDYHDVLLYLKAYPDNRLLLKKASLELLRVTDAIKKIMESRNYAAQRTLSGTGMAGTLIIAQFSFDITQWLIQNFEKSISFESAGGTPEQGAAILHSVIPNIEYFYATQGEHSLQKRIEKLFLKTDTLLKNIIDLFATNITTGKLRDALYDELKIFTEWKLEHPVYNRSFIQSILQKTFFHKNLAKKINIAKIIASPHVQAISLSKKEKNYLVNIARASLAFYCRETDPVTYANAEEVTLFSCGRGLTIALYSMQPERRLSIESYIGYMVFKNAIPVAYGGGWIFGERCKIGLHIYPPFRKGESAYLFAQVLRVYHQYFHIQRFIIKPYQFGKGNTEGLRSGAFWFYYKLGFRPTIKKIADVAANEYDNRKQTPESVLKLFTHCNLELVLKATLLKDFDASLISQAITLHINNQYNGNRTTAIHQSLLQLQQIIGIKKYNSLPPHLPDHILQFSLMIALLPQIKEWNKKEKKGLADIVLSKVHRNERKYILLLQKHNRLIQELYNKLAE